MNNSNNEYIDVKIGDRITCGSTQYIVLSVGTCSFWVLEIIQRWHFENTYKENGVIYVKTTYNPLNDLTTFMRTTNIDFLEFNRLKNKELSPMLFTQEQYESEKREVLIDHLKDTIDKLKHENDLLKDYKDDIENSFKSVMDEKCSLQEIHCGCVPFLKREITRLKEEVNTWLKEAQENHDRYYDLLKTYNPIVTALEQENARLAANQKV